MCFFPANKEDGQQSDRAGAATGQRLGWASGISIDQRIANKIGAKTRFKSIDLGVQCRSGYYGCISCSGADRPVRPESSPFNAFHRIFGDVSIDRRTYAICDPSGEICGSAATSSSKTSVFMKTLSSAAAVAAMKSSAKSSLNMLRPRIIFLVAAGQPGWVAASLNTSASVSSRSWSE